jgi:hypothetical protein
MFKFLLIETVSFSKFSANSMSSEVLIELDVLGVDKEKHGLSALESPDDWTCS